MKADSKCFLQDVGKMGDVNISDLISENPSVSLWAGKLCPVKLEAGSVAGSFICIFFKRLETPDNRDL